MQPKPLVTRVTLADIAREAGVSSSAVSLALRGRPGVGAPTRERVIHVARRLGYDRRVPHHDGQALTIGLILKARPLDIGTTNGFYAPVLAGIEGACRSRGIDVRLATMPVDDQCDPLEVPKLVNDGSTDGLVVIGAYLSRAAGEALAGRVPLVLVDGYAEESAKYDSVVSDNVIGAEMATRHLLSAGHRAIALVGTSDSAFPSIHDRRRGYLRALEEASLKPILVDGPHDDPRLMAARLETMLSERPHITAVFAANDATAIAVMQRLQRAGIRLPDDLSIVGFDDIDLASMVLPALDTVTVDKLAMGRMAISLLEHRLDYPGDAPVTTTIAPFLSVRESIAGARHGSISLMSAVTPPTAGND